MRTPRGAWLLLVALLACTLALGPTVRAAQAAASPVLVVDLDDATVATKGDVPLTFHWRLLNINPDTRYPVRVEVSGVKGWTSTVVPDPIFVPAGGETNVSVVLTPSSSIREKAEFDLAFHVYSPQTGADTPIPRHLEVIASSQARVLGLFHNPLPFPFDNEYGVFGLDLAFWALVGLAVILTGDSIVRYATRYAPAEVTKVILGKLRAPLFAFAMLLGIKGSFNVLPPNPITDFLTKTIAVIAVGILGVYVAYKVLDAVLYYYAVEIAPRTETKLDDIIVPALRKVAVVFVVIYGIAYSLRTAFGVDLSFLFAGAGIAGLVLAFAAQDTLSNFFSGLFILLDQPFAEGDDIQIETGEICRVDNIGLRSTRLYHYMNHEAIILPNNQLASKRIVNLAAPDNRYRVNIDVGVAYGTDLDKAKSVLLELAKEHALVINDDLNMGPRAAVVKFGESSVDMALRVYINNFRDRGSVRSDLVTSIHKAFGAEGIEIPFPQRTLWIKDAHANGDARHVLTPDAPVKTGVIEPGRH